MSKQIQAKPVDAVTAAFNLKAWPTKTCGPVPTRDLLITAAGLLGTTRKRITGTGEQLAVAAYLRPRDDNGFNHPAIVAKALSAVTGSKINNERRNVVQHKVNGIAAGLKLVNLISVNGAWHLELTKLGEKQVAKYRTAMNLDAPKLVEVKAPQAPTKPVQAPAEAPLPTLPEQAETHQQAA